MFFGKLLPREGNFFEMFNQHADRIVEAAHAFAKLVENYADPHLRDKYNQEVDNAERAADRVTHDVNKAIHITFITPIDREQIHSLINTMDDIADLIQDSAETMALYDVRHMTDEITRVWLNPDNGHHYALGPDGATLNGMPTVGRPEWIADRPADAAYGPMKPWGGGECPVPPETPVRAVFRGRRPYIGPAIWPSFPATSAKR